MTDKLKDFLSDYKDYLAGNDLESFYEELVELADKDNDNCIVGEFTKMLLNSDIDIFNFTKEIYSGEFYGIKLSKLEIHNGITKICRDAFWGSQINNIIVPETVTEIEEYGFYYCVALTDIQLPNTLTKLNQGMFYDCRSLTSIDVPEGITEIGGQVFRGCKSLERIKLPKSLVKIGDMAFTDCQSLTNLEIPPDVTEIGWHALWSGIDSLEKITLPQKFKSEINKIFDTDYYDINSLDITYI